MALLQLLRCLQVGTSVVAISHSRYTIVITWSSEEMTMLIANPTYDIVFKILNI